MEPPNSQIYKFGDFQIDVGRRLLFKGQNENLTLTPKVFDTLLYLLERRGEVVEKDELLSAVWPDTVVEENNLSQNISVLRRTLGEKKAEHRFIVTIPGRGYKFVAEAREIVPESNRVDEQPTVRDGKFPTGQYEVERRGNVLALAEWKADKSADETERSLLDRKLAANHEPSRVTISRTLVTVVISVLIFAVMFAAYWFGLPKNRSVADGDALSVTRLTNGFFPYDATISRDGKYFVYHEQDGNLSRIWLQQTGHSSRVEIIPASEQLLFSISFSPDGQFVYFVASENLEAPRSLFRVPTLGGNPKQILSGIDSYVSFSMDGREVLFSRFDRNAQNFSYLITASDGTSSERILLSRSTAFADWGNASWSPDGKTIVFGSLLMVENTVRCEIMAIPSGGGEAVPVSDEKWDACYRIAWRPDSRGFYMVGTRLGESSSTKRDQVYFISYPGGRSRRITNDESRHQTNSLGVTDDGSILAVPFNRSSQIWVMDSNGDSSTAVQITTGTADGRSGIAPLADDRIAYIARTGETLSILSMNQDGSNAKQLVSDPPYFEELRSGGEGKYLLFSANQGRFNHLFRIKSEGTELTQLTFGESSEIDSTVSSDGRWVTYGSVVNSGTQQQYSLWKMSMDQGEPISLNRDDCGMPHFSPDDKFISCLGDRKVLIVSADDGRLLRSFDMPPRSALNFGAKWTPDGKAFVYIVNEKDEASNLWLQPIDGSEPKRLTNFSAGSIYRFAYSLNGTHLYLARGQQIRDAVLIKVALRD